MKSRKTVMVFGTFDILHRGHLSFFQQARKFGNYLIVVVARDANVFKIKNRPPLLGERIRVSALKKVKFIGKVILGGKNDPLEIVENIKPKAILLGYDQKTRVVELEKKLQKRGLDVEIHRAKAYKPRIYKSSKLSRLLTSN